MNTVIELFAGLGGFRLGLRNAGWETIYSNQWEPSTIRQHASEVYVHQFGPEGHSNEDISVVAERNLTKRCIPNADLLVGGFPCQDYSVAKSKNSAQGIDGDYKVHINEKLLHEKDEPMLQHGLVEMNGSFLQLPTRKIDRPDGERLNIRFQEFIGQ